MGKPITTTIYAANHPQAIAEIIICDAIDDLTYGSIDIFALDDLMSKEDKGRVYSMIEMASSKLPPDILNRVERFIQKAKNTNFDGL